MNVKITNKKCDLYMRANEHRKLIAEEQMGKCRVKCRVSFQNAGFGFLRGQILPHSTGEKLLSLTTTRFLGTGLTNDLVMWRDFLTS